MMLFRALYQRVPQLGGTLRPMTFAARDAQHALQTAEDWQLPTDRLLVLKPLRPLQRPIMELTP